ncbi:MAG: type II toxin-antitoxin system HicB family antitoxin [Firmicutes bacterium]|nr:type II toxin-antitoxin system HicB family antitoxin [Bacillota bacterium]
MSYQYNIRLIPEEDGRWTAEVPALPGCVTWGNTREEALERIKEAIELFLEVLTEEGKPIPEDPFTFTKIEVAL